MTGTETTALAANPHVVDVRIADAEPLRSFVRGVSDAFGMLATLSPEDLDGMPDAVVSGIARLRSAIAVLTGEAPAPPADGPERFRGVIIIEWPRAAGASPYSSLLSKLCTVTDAVTGKAITTCTRIAVRADVREIVTADLTLYADADGNPILDGEPVADGKQILTGTFPFAVAGMRVRQ